MGNSGNGSVVVGVDDDDDIDTVIVCQGPPRCMLEGDEAVQMQKDGCPWCSRVYVDSLGKSTVVEPGEA